MTSLLGRLDTNLDACLEGFEGINRFWDRRRNVVVAKILPGEFYVTKNSEMIATTLGSCVSACIWDPAVAIGGMNHFMLPLTDKLSDNVTWGNVTSDATRYGNYAMEHMINELLKHGASRHRLQAKVFGGAKVLRHLTDVGERNAEFVLRYLKEESIALVGEDLNDIHPRKVLFDPISGKVLMKHLRSMHNDTITSRERSYQAGLDKAPIGGDVELF